MEILAPFLRNVARIDPVERTPLPDGRLRIVRRWAGVGRRRAARPAAAPHRRPARLDRHGRVDAGGRARRLDPRHLRSTVAALYTCTGTSRFEPDTGDPANWTRIRVRGRLVVHAERLPGVPSFLGRRLAPQWRRSSSA